jgi:hypothetical protein
MKGHQMPQHFVKNVEMFCMTSSSSKVALI